MKRIALYILLILVLIVIFSLVVIPEMGNFLIVDDHLVRADFIVVLMGSLADRSLEAADLYHSGYADEILFGNELIEGLEMLKARGINVPESAEILSYVLVELGVPVEAIKVLPEQALSTLEEAHIVGDYLKERQDINNMILVTSSYHTRRSKLTFESVFKTLGLEITVLSRPSQYSLFRPEQWWADRESAKVIVQEYQKLAYFWFWERFKIE
jgi:uncharacterized SAM-binding protein YcdF (DUF218 family)